MHILLKHQLLGRLLLLTIFTSGLHAKEIEPRFFTTNTLHIGVPHLPLSADPRTVRTYTGGLVFREVLATLVEINDKGRLVAGLAKRWRISESGTLYTFNLRSNLRFSDGSSITAQEVAIAIASNFWLDQQSAEAQVLADVVEGATSVTPGSLPSGIKVKSSTELTIKLQKPYTPLLFILSHSLWGVTKVDLNHNIDPSVCSGSYCVVALSKLQLILHRNIYSLRKNRNLPDHIILKTHSDADQDTIEDLLLSKNYDFFLDGGFPYRELDRNVDYKSCGPFGYYHLIINPDREAFKSQNNRRLFGEAIRRTFHETTTLPTALEPADRFFPSGFMEPSYYTSKKAKGIAREDNQKVEKATPHNIKMILSPKFRNLFNQTKANHLLKDLQISVDAIYPTISELFEALRSSNFDVTMLGYRGTFSDPDSLLFPFRKGTLFPDTFSPVKTFFEIFDTIRFNGNPIQRMRDYSKGMQIFEESSVVIPLFHSRPTIWSKRDAHLQSFPYHYQIRLSDLGKQIR